METWESEVTNLDVTVLTPQHQSCNLVPQGLIAATESVVGEGRRVRGAEI